jgi:hypothetical protein
MVMTYEGNLRKLQVTLADPVQYVLPVGEARVALNPLLGQTLQLHYEGEIHCIHCGRKTSKSFNQGYCFPCMQTLAECDSCLVKPELCHYHEGTCREPAWGEEHCFQDHYVYLANTSGLKVGITRQTNLPTRWLDQGATQALPIYKVKDRLTSGLVEVILKQHVADKTAWQRMLKGAPEDLDLVHEREHLQHECRQEIAEVLTNHGDEAVQVLANDQTIAINYPVTTYPDKVTALNLDKTAQIGGTLVGIKGQYLIFDTGVLNVRKYSGYKIRLLIGDGT